MRSRDPGIAWAPRTALTDSDPILGDEPTTRGYAVRGGALVPDGLSLLVAGDGSSTVHPLPHEGTVVIGRADDVHVRIDDLSLSRRHAQLHIGPKLYIEDLGSANGTVVHSVQLEAGEMVEISPGVAVEVGGTVIIVQGRLPGERRPRPRGQSARMRRIGSHSYFEVRLEEECTHAEQTRTSFAVMRIHLEDPVAEYVIQEVLCDVLRPVDPIGTYGPGEYEAILTRTSAATAEKVSNLLEKAFEGKDARVRVGIASYPHDGRSPEALLQKANERTQDIAPGGGERDIVIRDRVMVRLHRLIERVAAGYINVLLLGETGVGKEILAQAVHKHSKRVDKPFIKINCSALTESLFESELFGHEKGAFTGAIAPKKGLLEAASGGTFFLDEVGEMPASIQAKLLTVIEDRKVLRVGSLEPIDIDVRFVAATNRDLEEEVARGNFRQDLYYRLNGVALVIPPLRERTAEIERLAGMFVREAAKQIGLARPPVISAETLALLQSYRWPGNIRELRNVLERAVLLCLGERIELEHLPLEKMRGTVLSPNTGVGPAPQRPAISREASDSAVVPTMWDESDLAGSGDTLAPPGASTRPFAHNPLTAKKRSKKKTRGVPPEGTPQWTSDRQEIIDALEECAGNQSEAAKRLGVSRRTLVSRLIQFRIPRPRKALPKK